jgi:hypothetical protein
LLPDPRFVPEISTTRLGDAAPPIYCDDGDKEYIVTVADVVVVVVDVVDVVDVELPFVIVNPVSYVSDCPSALVTTTSQYPVSVSEGMVKEHDITVDDSTSTSVAVSEVSPDFFSNTFAPVAKFEPSSSSISTSVPVCPESGEMSFIFGAYAADVVAVVTMVVAVVVGAVVTVVGAPIVMDETLTVVTISVYAFSRFVRLIFDVLESIRYPQLPSL